jgi:methylmalonyl-CoA mutase C-terminal domain/subunit
VPDFHNAREAAQAQRSPKAMPKRPIRVLIAKPGLDGHDRGAKVVANALRDAGMEVIYTGLHQTPDMIVEAALQEDVDVIALSVLSGAHMTLFKRVRDLMEKSGLGSVTLVGGGIIPDQDVGPLKAMGVSEVFGPGTDTRRIVEYIRKRFEQQSDQEKSG